MLKKHKDTWLVHFLLALLVSTQKVIQQMVILLKAALNDSFKHALYLLRKSIAIF